jgi:hypothetical protein
MKSDDEVKEFIKNELAYTRNVDDKYAMLITINNEMYTKSKLKTNDVEFQIKELKDIILYPAYEVKLDDTKLIKSLLLKENEILSILNKNQSVKFITSYLHAQLIKSLNSTFSKEITQEINDVFKQNFSIDQLKPFISQLDFNNFTNLKEQQYLLTKSLKFALNSKTYLNLDFNEKIVKENEAVSVSFLRLTKAMRIYKRDAFNGKVFKMLFSNLTIESDSFNRISSFSVKKLNGKGVRNYLNSLVYCPDALSCLESINKIDDINFVLLFTKKHYQDVKSNIHQPYIIIEAEDDEVEELLINLDSNAKINSIALDKVDYEALKVDPEHVRAGRTKKEIKDEKGDNEFIPFKESVDKNSSELISSMLNSINLPLKGLAKEDFMNTLNNISTAYMRHFLVHILSYNTGLITQENYKFLTTQFKIVYFDSCLYSALTTFAYLKFYHLNNVLLQLEEKQDQFGLKFLDVSSDSKMVDVVSTMKCSEFETVVQTELVEVIFDNRLNLIKEDPSQEKLVNLILDVFDFVKLSLNLDTKTLSLYLLSLQNLLNNFIESVNETTPIDVFEDYLMKLKGRGFDKLFRFLSDSIEKETNHSSRTKILLSFLWDISRVISVTYKRVYKLENSLSSDNLSKMDKIQSLFNTISLVNHKSKDRELRNNYLYQIEEITKALTHSIQLPLSDFVYQRNMNFEKCKKHKLKPNNPESKNKLLVIAEKANNGVFKLSSMVGDDDKSIIKVCSSESLLIANKDQTNDELWMAGYNDGYKMGNDTLYDCQYVYVPYKSMIDKDIRIKKIQHGYRTVLVSTYDNKFYTSGKDHNSGIEGESKTFTLKNKWNDILKKGEKLIDFTHNEYYACVFVTDKNVYVSGYNNNNIFDNVCSNSSYTPDIMKLSTPFKANKVAEVSLGYGHCIYRLEDGTCYGSGSNCYSELNMETFTNISTPTKINFGSSLICEKVSCGYYCSLFLMKERDGKVRLYSCGSSDYGQNGQGTSTDKRFKKCIGVENVEFKYVKIGYTCSLAITSDNKLYSWGYGGYGPL